MSRIFLMCVQCLQDKSTVFIACLGYSWYVWSVLGVSRVFLFNEFLSEAECDGLRRVHDKHVQEMASQPLLCFDSLRTLRKHLEEVNRNADVSPNDFVKGMSTTTLTSLKTTLFKTRHCPPGPPPPPPLPYTHNSAKFYMHSKEELIKPFQC